MTVEVLFGIKIGLECEDGLLDVCRDDPEQPPSVDVHKFKGLFACHFELQGVKRLVELVDLGLDLLP